MADLSPFEDASVAPIIGTPYRVNSVMADRVNRLIAAAPEDLQTELRHSITSGYRDWETQAKLYLHYLARGGLAAKPGSSWHERYHGMAVDWNRATPKAWAYLKANGPQYGIVFPLGPKDPYHSQPVETVHGNSRIARGGEGMFASLGAVPETPALVAPETAPHAPLDLPLYHPGTIVAPPIKPIPEPPLPRLATLHTRAPHARLSGSQVPSFGSAMRTALADILRRR